MCLALRAGHARRRAVREVPKRPERAVPEAEAGAAAGAAEPPGPAAAERVARVRAWAPVASSPYESAEPMKARARNPATPCRMLMEPQPAAWRARGPRAGQAPPGALEVRAVPRSWKVEALAGRLQPEEQPARVAQAPAVQAPAVRAPAVEAQVPPARAQVGCSKPEAPCGVRRVRYPSRQCRRATRPASPAPSGVRPATRRAQEALAWPKRTDPRRASPARSAGRPARRRSWSAPAASSASATLG